MGSILQQSCQKRGIILKKSTTRSQYSGTVWCSPWSLDITSYLKKGKNRLEIKVANNLWNRLVGMASGAGNGDLTRQTHPLATEDSSLTPSGLLGKVRISVYR